MAEHRNPTDVLERYVSQSPIGDEHVYQGILSKGQGCSLVTKVGLAT